ncbi:MAG: ATP phosphoribosyltransferase catalytic subunit HisG, partial [Rhodobacteraceae bacterium]|nr:ATP phosphoribosyltransferase catalytic subunit HisG [Paracoccaceae bacterium]
AVADITSTGETLRANHLKLMKEGLILRSQATLWRSRVSKCTKAESATLAELQTCLGTG